MSDDGFAADDFAGDDFDSDGSGGFGFDDDDPLGSGGGFDDEMLTSSDALAKPKVKKRKKAKEINMPLVIGGVVGLGVVGLLGVVIWSVVSGGDDPEPTPNRSVALSPSEPAAAASSARADRDDEERDSARDSRDDRRRREERDSGNDDSDDNVRSNRSTDAADDSPEEDESDDEDAPSESKKNEADETILGSQLLSTYRDWEKRPGVKMIGAIVPEDEESMLNGFSWMTELLPHMGYQEIYDKIDFEKSWYSSDNFEQSVQVIPEFQNPLDDRRRWEGYPFQGTALTHFAGVSGVARKRTEVAAKLKRSHKQAGVFGYKEILPTSKIGDGASNTIAIIGAGELAGPWAAAGGATIRGARAPYFDEMSGFGTKGSAKPGAVALRADGSASFVSSKIDPKVFAAMCTANGGEEGISETDWQELPTIPEDKIRKFRTTTVSDSDGRKVSDEPWQDGDDEDEDEE